MQNLQYLWNKIQVFFFIYINPKYYITQCQFCIFYDKMVSLYFHVTIYKTREHASASFNAVKNKILKIRGIEQNISERDLNKEKRYDKNWKILRNLM